MGKKFKKLYDFDDILIEPAVVSFINSRKELNPRDQFGMLPLLSAPMDTVIDENNWSVFHKNNIYPVIPRKTKIENPHSLDVFSSYSMDEFEFIFLNNGIVVNTSNENKLRVLIDVANGHLDRLFTISNEAKKMYGDNMCLMVGNVANPLSFLKYCNIGVDMVRLGIGNGSGCLTSTNTSIGYPSASLIKECYDIRKKSDKGIKTKIVADGGFKKYSDIIKALGLGADYVMLGSIFNKALESAGETTNEFGDVVDQYSEHTYKLFNVDAPLYKTFRGMSTKEVQRKWGKEVLTTSEGVVRKNKVEYTLSQWCENFEDYLRSAMSYTGKHQLHQFIGGVNYNLITQNSFKRFDK